MVSLANHYLNFMIEKIKKILLLSLFLGFIFLPLLNAEAKRGCCSWHGGVSYCDTSVGRYVCNDGTYSPTCRCAYLPPTQPTYTPPTQTKDDLIKKEVENLRADYYKNHQWFREKLIANIVNSLKADVKRVAFYVYTMLPDIK